MPPTPDNPALVLVGAGLANALTALAVLDARPDAQVHLLERGARPCGNHTWSFHATDVPAGMTGLVDAIAEHRWPDYDVAFPDGSHRRVDLGYGSISSDHLAALLEERVAAAPNATLSTGVEVTHVDADGATLADGTRTLGDLVIDARGPAPDPTARCGYQKFYGLELDLDMPHGLERPLLMDATLEQIDGFRFLYVLPLGPTRLLVEDTVFSTRPDLLSAAWRARALDEAAARGWTPRRIVREEQGVLPMPWRASGPQLQQTGPFDAGYRGQWFHPATGYSVPVALRVAALVAEHADDPARLFETEAYRRLVKREQKQSRFARFLNRLLFTGVSPETRWTVFRRFYRQPEHVIARFYALTLKPTDRARMLVGRPPKGFSLKSALAGSAIG
ncbi:MAG: lycopene beta-cyclase CrtY [Planctomycetota bacterium]|nr:lycopene beta-cyclase CrtY [Planctomycetota bacterium]